MANTLAPFGLTPIRRLDGAAWSGNQSHRLIAATNTNNIYQGDVVKSLNTGYIDVAAPGSTQIAGIFVGCEYLSASTNKKIFTNHFPGSDVMASTTVDAYIIDDPLCVFLAQTAGTSGSPIGLSAIGNNVNFNASAASGNNLNGISGMTIDDNTVNTTNTLPFRVVGVPGLDVPNLGAAVNGYDTTTKYNVVLVAFNNQDFKSLTGI
jgi:hypothetical protein